MSTRLAICLVVLIVAAGACAGFGFLRGRPETIQDYQEIGREPQIRPDYAGAVIPPNIAPLNFRVEEPGIAYCARISSAQGNPVEVFSETGTIEIDEASWHALLQENRGQELRIDVFAKDENDQWSHFTTVTNRIALEDIDNFLVYRKMHPTHLRVKGEIGIYCRDLTGFDEAELISGMRYENGCVNCHSFPGNRGGTMLLGVRSPKFGVGTLLVDDGTVQEIGTKFGYTSWHPSGRLAVYSVNNLPMFRHSSRNEVRDTVDLNSYLACYLNDEKNVRIEPNLARKDHLENWPAWSGDGRYLYFCSTPKLWPDNTPNPPMLYDQVRYSLMRVSYDVDTKRWGPLETVLSSKDTDRSIAMPRCSPDGRWLSFCMCDYGYFPAWQASSDLYLMDLTAPDEAGRFAFGRLDINSDMSESWQTWSSNSRWIIFSSKRLHGVFTRLFISYVDPNGTVQKPILLPQRDPGFYESCLRTFNTPELVTERPTATGEALARVFRSHQEVAVRIPMTMATPKPGQAPSEAAWQSQRE